MKGVAVPSRDLDDVGRETDMNMACIAAVDPHLYEDLCIPPSMMVEVLAATEAQGIYEHDAALTQKRAKKKFMESAHADLAKRYFKKPVAGAWASKEHIFLVGCQGWTR